MEIFNPYKNWEGIAGIDASIRAPKKEQFLDIMSQFPSKGGISPLFESAVESWKPTQLRHNIAQLLTPSGAAGSTLPDIPLMKGGMYVTPLKKDPSDFEKVDWARTFQHELMHPSWEYEKKDPVLSKYGVGVGRNKPNWAALFDPEKAASSTNPGYTGEEQWNYMHDLMYGPRMDFLGGAGPETLVSQYQLRDRGLIEPGMETYTPYAHDVIARSGLTSAHKKAIGFGVNPFEDTKAAGQWYQQQKYRKMSQAKKQAQMQQTIRQHEAAEAAKQKAQAQAQAQASQRQADQARISRAYREETGGQAGSYAPGGGSGAHAADASGSTYSDPFDPGGGEAQGGFIDGTNRRRNYFNGGLIDFFRYGGFI